MKLTIMKTASCIVMLSVNRLVIKLATEPIINHIETKFIVVSSINVRIMKIIIHIILIKITSKSK